MQNVFSQGTLLAHVGPEARRGHMVLHSLHIPNSQLYVSEPPPEWFGNGPNEVRSLWPTSCSLR